MMVRRTFPGRLSSRRIIVVALALLVLASCSIVFSVVSPPAEASVDYPGVYSPGWSYVASQVHYKNYANYGGGGYFIICAYSAGEASTLKTAVMRTSLPRKPRR